MCNLREYRSVMILCRLVCIKQGQTITSDKVILDIVKCYKLDFITMPTQAFPPQQPKFEKHEEMALNTLLEELIQKGVIVKCFHEDGEFISPVFLRHKKNVNIA